MDVQSVYFVTFCGTGVKPRPSLFDITSAAALNEVMLSGTDIFSLVHVLFLTKSSIKFIRQVCLKHVHTTNFGYLTTITALFPV